MSAFPQNFSVTLGGTSYRCQLRYNKPSAVWILNILDISGNPIVNGIPLVTGSDLLAQFKYLGFDGALVVTKDDGDPAPPTWDNLGTIGKLFWLDKVA
jgi:hypothetical protein